MTIEELTARAELIALVSPVAEGRIPRFRIRMFHVREVLWGGWPYQTIDLFSGPRSSGMPPKRGLLFAEHGAEPIDWRAIDIVAATPANIRRVKRLLS